MFVTTKLWVQDAGHEKTKKAFGRSLRRLGLAGREAPRSSEAPDMTTTCSIYRRCDRRGCLDDDLEAPRAACEITGSTCTCPG